ncbi:hypothetical protein F4813DRAFT_389436 [Daldinia decipiens]|uniref:uncharacterized protein n=1 Tax=Daldinia decipiens TaxID=326647 RepID=UPI0020C2EC6C|nr:uncharacterized protein F4813DRAFT_389436 [Daldinia decipiens]KAI1657699.1 hypothetical protein F4813DRAFT_389436 [Daldinia decipiens]
MVSTPPVSPRMLAFIWGPIKFLLLTATTWLESFDALLDAYQLIAESLPIFEIYQDLFSESSRMQGILECIWTNILDFHIRAIRIFDQSMIKLFFRSLWKDFNSRFQHIISDLQRLKALIESHANQIHIWNYESDRVKIREEFEQTRASQSGVYPHYSVSTDHFLAMLSTSKTSTREWFAESTETSNALTIFADRFHADLAASSTVSKTPPDYSLFSSLGYFPAMTMIWKHAEPRRLLIDNRRDDISLVSLGKSIGRNRHVFEEYVESITDDRAEMTALEKSYGPNWFKCRKVSCYYFHEGFNSRASRQQHYDRHERPFKCDEENCPAAWIGFGSLKELEKHKRNVHPGIDKLSSTFAKFKRGSKGQAVLLNYLCPRCPLKFATRLECRSYMTLYNPKIHPKDILLY